MSIRPAALRRSFRVLLAIGTVVWTAIAASKIVWPDRIYATILYETDLSTRAALVFLGAIVLVELLPLTVFLACGLHRELGATHLALAVIPLGATILGVGDACGCMGGVDWLEAREARMTFGVANVLIGLGAIRWSR